ncbi:MAG: DUF4838 domain-containing protein [Clostridia bacterium]|nr:DUF4838 domain-containing protein [Clostridia bacterium]
MKKLRIITAVAFVVMLCCLLAVSASAKWWDDNPFTDVKSTSWYYDAVRICNENGLFEGMTENTFATSTGMTRSMFVTVLAAADEGYDASQYTKSSFSDIREGSWYLAPAEWANSIGVANGIGEGAFGPKNTITRQELALMLYKYAQYKGMDVTTDGSVDMSAYPDNSTASSWATTALEWSVQKGLISGVASGNETILSPKGTATRAMVAQIMVKYLALDPVREINGNDISKYTIVYSASELSHVGRAANSLSEFIEKSIGVKLPVVTDEAEVSDYEILVGKTNREDKGIVTVDRSFEDKQKFVCTVQGDYLVIYGIDSDDKQDTGERTTYNVNGSENAVVYFLEEEFGLNFYYDDEGISATPDPVISFDDGYYYSDAPEFETRVLYMADAGSDYYLGCGYYYSEWGCGLPHQLGNLLTGVWRETYENTWGTPCLSDPANIESLIKNVRELLTEKPTVNLVGLIQNDSDSYCTCQGCFALYREAGSRCGALLNIVNIVCETFEEEYPNVKFATWAYTWSSMPPKEGTMTLHKNVVLVYNTLVLCPAHEYSDDTCEYNDTSAKYIRRWGELAEHLYLWDHSGAFTDAMTPFPDFDSIRPNANYFYDNGVEGVFMNSHSERLADFCELRYFLLSRLYRKPQMTEDEYRYHMNGFLKAYYGDGWQYLRNYIDKIAELGNSKCHTFHSPTGAYYDYDEVLPYVELLDGYWDKAEAMATDADQLDHIKFSRLSWTYLKQNVLYESMYNSGNEALQLEYRQANQALYDAMLKYDTCVSEHYDVDEINFSPSTKPEDWQ